VHLDQGNYSQATAYLEESQAVGADLKDQVEAFWWRYRRGGIAFFERRFDDARRLFEEAMAFGEGAGNPGHLGGWCKKDLGLVALELGVYPEARSLLEHALQVGEEFDDRNLLAYSLEGFSGLATALEQHERAVSLAGAIAALREALGNPRPLSWQRIFEHRLDISRAALKEAATGAAWKMGHAMSLEDAVGYARESVQATVGTSYAAQSAQDRLTRREQEVAALVAEGLTNAQIAERLVITRRTVRRDSRAKLAIARSALCRWLEEVLSKPLEPADAQRLARVLGWLRETPLPRRGDVATALSTDAFANLLRICGDAIANGRGRDWTVDASQLSRSSRWAFNRWSIALMALVSGTTGLRRQSLVLIEVDDWGELQPGHFWLCWKHDKKREEHDAVLERGVALLLDEYKQRTATLRAAMGTRRLFLRIDLEQGTWVTVDADWIWQGLRLLGDRAVLALPDGTVGLTTRLLRRTVATRQVQAGAHIEAIAAQLGHSTTHTTMQYVRYDRLTHATDVREALDAGAKLALLPWDQGPRLLADLPADERARFLGARPEHDVGVGLCDEATCVMVKRGSSIPPCFLCSHLLTGPEFLLELNELRQATRAEAQSLPAISSFSALQANKRYELECLDRLIAGVQTRAGLLAAGEAPLMVAPDA
jgi:integrase